MNEELKKMNNWAKSLMQTDVWYGRCLSILTVAAFITRYIGLENPPGTTWDEVHFGKFANKYIQRTFFHDVHPPLGKMLIAASLKLFGYNGSFSFEPSTLYPDEVPYVQARMMFATLGALYVPLSYCTVHRLTSSVPASVVAAIAVLSDHLTHRLSTLIILEPPLIFVIMASVFFSFSFYYTEHREFSSKWWLSLSLTGVCLGLVMSIKYVGVFTVCFVGLQTLCQLVIIVTSKERPLVSVIPHFLARVICLIILPILLYLSTFVLHFLVLSNWTPGEGGFYHTKFVTTFNNTIYDGKYFPKYVEYGANLTVKSSYPLGGTLESWYDLFPSEFTAPCQQVSTSPVTDMESMIWTIRYVNITAGSIQDNYKSPEPNQRIILSNHDHIVLTHQTTERSLRSHGHKAAMSKKLRQVCCYGENGTAGPLETWQIIVPDLPIGVPIDIWSTDFKLKNYQMECYLVNPGNIELPKEWTYEMAREVACTKNENADGVMWHINWVNETKLARTVEAGDNSMSLWDKIVEVHKVNIIGNRALKPNNEEFRTSARPWMWPIIFRLQVMCQYTEEMLGDRISGFAKDSPSNSTGDEQDTKKQKNTKKSVNHINLGPVGKAHIVSSSFGGDTGDGLFAVMIHNPVLAYLNLLSLALCVMMILYHWYTELRGGENCEHRQRAAYASHWLLLCYVIHFAPFFFMTRILYMHHYAPAFIFSCMVTGVMCNFLLMKLASLFASSYRDLTHLLLVSSLSCLLLLSYYLLFPLATSVRGLTGSVPDSIFPLKSLHLGQAWAEIGLNEDYYVTSRLTTLTTHYDSSNYENPDVDVRLLYNDTLYENLLPQVEEGTMVEWLEPLKASDFKREKHNQKIDL